MRSKWRQGSNVMTLMSVGIGTTAIGKESNRKLC